MALKIIEADDYYCLIIRGMEYQVKKTSVTFGSIDGEEIEIISNHKKLLPCHAKFVPPMLDIPPLRIALKKRTFNLAVENVRESDFEDFISERVAQSSEPVPDICLGGFKIERAQLVACVREGALVDGFYPKVVLKFESQVFA